MMKHVSLLLPLAALALAAPPALANDRSATVHASIPFADYGAVENWRAESDRVIYFEGTHNRWYRAELFSPAFGLRHAYGIGIETSPGGALDKWSAIRFEGRRYPFLSFERAEGPPARHRESRG